MKLTPFIDKEDPVQKAVIEALQAGGLVKSSSKMEMDKIREVFDDHGASIIDVAKMTGAVMRTSDKEELRIRAGELALKVHGIFKEMDEKPIPQINISVVGDGNMVNLLCPTL